MTGGIIAWEILATCCLHKVNIQIWNIIIPILILYKTHQDRITLIPNKETTIIITAQERPGKQKNQKGKRNQETKSKHSMKTFN